MEVAMDMDMDWLVTFVSPDNPTARISVVQAEEEAAQHTGMSLTVEVADVDADHAKAEAVGVEIVYPLTDEPWGVRRCHVLDPIGVVVNVISRTADELRLCTGSLRIKCEYVLIC